MNGLIFFICNVLPYISFPIFGLGVIYRLWRWFIVPVPLRIRLTPSPTTWKGTVGRIAAEILLLKSLFKSERFVWFIAIFFHWAGVLVLLNHGLGIVDAFLATYTTYEMPGIKTVLYILACFAFVILTCLLIFLGRRTLQDRLKGISMPTDYLLLILFLCHIIAGTYMSFFTEIDLGQVARWGLGLATFHPAAPPESWVFPIHAAFGQILFLYFPFSKLFHSFGMLVNRWVLSQKEELLIPGGAVVK